jgi:hypothetical protein
MITLYLHGTEHCKYPVRASFHGTYDVPYDVVDNVIFRYIIVRIRLTL